MLGAKADALPMKRTDRRAKRSRFIMMRMGVRHVKSGSSTTTMIQLAWTAVLTVTAEMAGSLFNVTATSVGSDTILSTSYCTCYDTCFL